MSARYLTGDVFTVLAGFPDASVDLVLTSPPFLALRSYLPAGHPDKAKELGSEASPAEYIDMLDTLTEELARVITPHGSLCVELGDTYANSGGAGGDYNADGFRDGQPRFRQARGKGWPEPKSLCLIPELYRVSLVYGFNPLTGRPTPRWRARNVVRWCRPNPPVGELGDKVRPATSDMIVACKSGKRWFDLDAVRTPVKHPDQRLPAKTPDRGMKYVGDRIPLGPYDASESAGTPPLDHWWVDDVFDQDAWYLATEPYKGSHYATFPEALCAPPIQAMCPRRVCVKCGQPSVRLTEPGELVDREGRRVPETVRRSGDEFQGSGSATKTDGGKTRESITVGWSDCGHDAWRRGIVLDPFAGSGTVLAVADGHGRDSIGIDLDPRNAELARGRCGMFLTVE